VRAVDAHICFKNSNAVSRPYALSIGAEGMQRGLTRRSTRTREKAARAGNR